MKLKDCNLDMPDLHHRQRHHKEYEVILLRSCLSPENFGPDLDVCMMHKNMLGRNFGKYMHLDSCHHPDHLAKSGLSATKRVSYDEALNSLEIPSISLPYGLPLCVQCYRSVTKELLNKTENKESSVYFEDPQVGDLSQTFKQRAQITPDPHGDEGGGGFIDESEGSSSEHSTQTTRTQQEKAARAYAILQEKVKMDALNEFMKKVGQYDPFPSKDKYKDARFDSDRSRQLKVLKGVARGLCSILETVTHVEADRAIIWDSLKKSGYVEKLLKIEPMPSDDLAELIEHWNKAPNYDARIRTLASVIRNYSFATLNQFNEKDERETLEEDEVAFEEKEDLNDTIPCFNPPLTRYIYNKTVEHHDNSKHFLEAVIREPKNYWKFKEDIVMAIINFATGPSITQQVAYNTRLVDDPTGGKTRIAKVMRRYCNADLARQIQSYLIEQQFDPPIPGLRTITRILQRMPASKQKSLEGLCPRC